MTPARCLEMAIAGETHEYTEMYPAFRHAAVQERNEAAVREIDEQIEESKEHAARFQATLDKAARGFAALARMLESSTKGLASAAKGTVLPMKSTMNSRAGTIIHGIEVTA